jgi:hypothetical protein
VLGWHVEAQAQYGTRQVPRLVVAITIDQLRSDYLENFAPYYGTNGFRKLLTQGLVYENAAYPFVSPDKASAISTIISGTTPSYHSIIGEQWLDRNSLRPINCTEDPSHPGVPTPSQLAVSTLGDEMKVSSQGTAKIFAIAPFEDMASLAAGHAADGAVWLNEKNGQWTSSQYHSSNTPQWILSFNELSNTKRKKEKTEWQPQIIHQKPDFKHVFKGNRRHLEYQTSGLINADITELALSCVNYQEMGADDTTDLLCLTYYAGPFDHKPVTECQKEIEDTYIRLDKELGNLVSRLESRVGKEEVLFVITSTGYSDPEGIDYARYRIPTGIFYVNRTANLLNMYFGALWGQGRYVEACYDNQLFLNHKLLESKRISLTDASQRAQEFISQMTGVKNVYSSLQLLNGSNGQLLKLRNSFNYQRNGDKLIEVAPGWHLQNEDTNYDRLSEASAPLFPIIIYGADIPATRVQLPVTTDRIAPTIAKTIHIRAPNACTAEPLF